MNIHAY